MTVDSSAETVSSSPVLIGEKIVFAGTLASMTHQQAYDLARTHGGEPTHHLSRQSTMLVIGEEGWPVEDDGKPSLKLQQGLQLRAEGQSLRLIKESVWLSLLGIEKEIHDVKRFYTPAHLSQLIGVSVQEIRHWERVGLIKAAHKIYRLPYFNFQEITRARKIAELRRSGLSLTKISVSLKGLRALYESMDLLSDIDLIPINDRLFAKDHHSLLDLKTRQRYFSFEASTSDTENAGGDHDESDDTGTISGHFDFSDSDDAPQEMKSVARVIPDWHIEGCRLLEDDLLEDAAAAFRRALQKRPDDVDSHFSLADTLYRLGKLDAAIERYYCVIEHEPEFLEAWTQLGCLFLEQQRFQEAIDSFRTAIELHPDYGDAHFHLAQALEQTGISEEAAYHRQIYAALNPDSPFAHV